MIRNLLLLLALGTSLHAQSVPQPIIKTEPLTLESYCRLTIERLELTRSCWYWLKESPTPVQLQALWDKYKTTQRAYLRYASQNRKELQQYLEVNSEVRGRIERLNEEIKGHIKAKGDTHENK